VPNIDIAELHKNQLNKENLLKGCVVAPPTPLAPAQRINFLQFAENSAK
jgi:hypothetical protein